MKEAFVSLTSLTDGKEDFEELYSKISDIKMTMSAFIDFLFRNPIYYMENVSDLIEQTQLYNNVVNDKTDKLYS